jgi:hypothetical protein
MVNFIYMVLDLPMSYRFKSKWYTYVCEVYNTYGQSNVYFFGHYLHNTYVLYSIFL